MLMLNQLAGFGGGRRGDPYWDDVTALLLFRGADGSTTFTDEKGGTWTASGGGTISTAQSVFNGSSYLNGTHLTTSNATLANVGTGNLTIDFSFRATSSLTGQVLIDLNNGSDQPQLSATLNASKLSLGLYQEGSYQISEAGSTTLSAGTWYYARLVKIGTNYYMYLTTTRGGAFTLDSSGSYGTTFANPSVMYLGSNRVPSGAFAGHIGYLRVTKRARTDNAPSVQFPAYKGPA